MPEATTTAPVTERIRLSDRDSAFLRTMLEGWPDLSLYFDIQGEWVVLQNTQYAGSGATFIIEAFKSLRGLGQIKLSQICRLDLSNQRVFFKALKAWTEG